MADPATVPHFYLMTRKVKAIAAMLFATAVKCSVCAHLLLYGGQQVFENCQLGHKVLQLLVSSLIHRLMGHKKKTIRVSVMCSASNQEQNTIKIVPFMKFVELSTTRRVEAALKLHSKRRLT